MRIEKLNHKASLEVLYAIKNYLEQADEEVLKLTLEGFVSHLDDLSCDDLFGTEGWEHAMGLSD